MKAFSILAFITLSFSLAYLNFNYRNEKVVENLRYPAAAQRVHQAPQLQQLFLELQAKIKQELNSTSDCYSLNKRYQSELALLRGSKLEMDLLGGQMIKEISEASFKTRLVLLEKLKNFNLKSPSGRRCLESSQKLFTTMRMIEDYLLELDVLSKGNLNELAARPFEGSNLVLFKNPKFSYFTSYKELKSGDIIFGRGNSFSSSALARLGEVDQLFNSVGLVYKDEKGEISVIESHLEIGLIVTPITDFLEQKNVRLMIYRFQDDELAAKSSKALYEKVNQSMKDDEIRLYDFAYNDQDEEEVFNVEMIHLAFKEASQDAVDIPLYKTKLVKTLKNFWIQMGLDLDEESIKTFTTISLNDLEFDPRIELVMEWKDATSVRDNRVKDLVLMKIFEWMSIKGYGFNPALITKFKGSIAWFLRRVPLISMKFEKQYPLNMKARQLNMMMGIEELGEKLQLKVDDISSSALSPLSPIEILELLDQYRLADEEKYQKFKNFLKAERGAELKSSAPVQAQFLSKHRPDFHLLFHP